MVAHREKMNCSNHVAEIVGEESENLIGMIDGVEFGLHNISVKMIGTY